MCVKEDVSSRSPYEALSARVIRSVNRRVAGDARPGKDAHACARAGSNQYRVIDRARVTRADVASLTEDGRLRDEHALVGRSMRIVTRHASIATRRVLPQEGTSLLGMARGAQLGNRIALAQQLHVRRAVSVVAGRTLHLAFAHGHVSRAVELGHLVAVTTRTHILLELGFQLPGRRLGRVDRVTRSARQVSRFVLAVVPERVLAFVVAGGAERVHFLGLRLLQASGLECIGRRIFEMLARRPMTRFTASRGSRRSRIGLPVVRGVDVAVVLFGVTRSAVCVTDVRGASLRGRRGRRRRGGLTRLSGLFGSGVFSGRWGNVPNQNCRDRRVRRRGNPKNGRKPQETHGKNPCPSEMSSGSRHDSPHFCPAECNFPAGGIELRTRDRHSA